MQFCNAYLSNKQSHTSLPNQGPHPESFEVGERLLVLLQLELHHVLGILGAFFTNYYHSFKAWFVPFGSALCCASFSIEKFSISPFSVGGPLFCAPFVHETTKHTLLLDEIAFFFGCLFWVMHIRVWIFLYVGTYFCDILH